MKKISDFSPLPQFRTQYNSHLFPKKYEKNSGISKTQPGMGYSLREILDKFTYGMAPDVQMPGQYAENPDFDEIDPTMRPDFDLADITEHKHSLQRKTNAKEQADKRRSKEEAFEKAQRSEAPPKADDPTAV